MENIKTKTNYLLKISVLTIVITFIFNSLLIASTPGVWGNGNVLLDVIWIEMPNGEEEPIYVDKYANGYILYSMLSDYTVIYDESLSEWCYAKRGEDGWLESSGFSIRFYTGKETGLRPNIKPSEERWNELEEKKENDDEQTRSYNAPWIPMPKTGNIQSLVIYVTLSDAMFNNATFTDNGWFNGNSPAHSTRRYFQEVSRNHLNMNFNFYTYRDTTALSFFLPNSVLINGQPNTNGYSTFAEFEERVQRLRRRAIGGVAGQNSNSLVFTYTSHTVNGTPRNFIDSVIVMLHKDITSQTRGHLATPATNPQGQVASIGQHRVNNYVAFDEHYFYTPPIRGI